MTIIPLLKPAMELGYLVVKRNILGKLEVFDHNWFDLIVFSTHYTIIYQKVWEAEID